MISYQVSRRIVPSFYRMPNWTLGKNVLIQGRAFSILPLPKKVHEAKNKVASTYNWVSFNLASTAISATVAYQMGIAEKVIDFAYTHHPLMTWASMCALTLPPVMAMQAIDEQTFPKLKKTTLTISNIAMSVVFSPMGFLGMDVVAPAALMTTGISATLAMAARKAKNDFQLQYQYPLRVGLGTLVGIGVCGFAFPASLGSFAHAASLYGGLAVFSGLMIADVQEVYLRAEEPDYSPMDQSYLIYLDVLNLFTRIAELTEKYKAPSSASHTNYESLSKENKIKIMEDRKNTTGSTLIDDTLSSHTEVHSTDDGDGDWGNSD